MKEYLSHLESIGKKAEANRVECEVKIEQLRAQGVELQGKLKEYERVFKNSNREEEYRAKIAAEEQQFLGFCKKRIEIASSLDMKRLAKLDIDERKSEANDLFKWILVAIYNEPENKYYWSNFKVPPPPPRSRPSRRTRAGISSNASARSTPSTPRRSRRSRLPSSWPTTRTSSRLRSSR